MDPRSGQQRARWDRERDNTGAVGVAGTVRVHLGGGDLRHSALVLLPGCAVPDKNELWIVSLMSSHVEEAALGKSDLKPSADWEPTLILIGGSLFQMPRLLQKSYCCGTYCLMCVQRIKGNKRSNPSHIFKKSR